MSIEIKTLLNHVTQISNTYNEYAKLTGENFNIFNILKLGKKETKHSAFLAELLNPNGSHGQGNVFAIEFIKALNNSIKSNFTKGEVSPITAASLQLVPPNIKLQFIQNLFLKPLCCQHNLKHCYISNVQVQ